MLHHMQIVHFADLTSNHLPAKFLSARASLSQMLSLDCSPDVYVKCIQRNSGKHIISHVLHNSEKTNTSNIELVSHDKSP